MTILMILGAFKIFSEYSGRGDEKKYCPKDM